MHRLFFGLEIPAAIRQRLLQVPTPVAGARWQRDDQFHITLLFLGDVESGRAVNARAAARDLPLEPFELDVHGLGSFGPPHNPRHVWAGVQPLNPIAVMHEALAARITGLGFTPEKRGFRPHVTLARFGKQPGSVAALLDEYQSCSFGSFTVSDFVLFESKRGDQGSVYSVVERFGLMKTRQGSSP
ncbi:MULTISPECIES: RNA 2',3'-cyclic phosphodiesterase [Marinobacter]|jgi:2'-5' RNA ligase|uniref:RNA 2',3'-cyclic phosphodiesterase n=1 Tax=Marinobacter TaxID=2742 RepID=UPI00200647E5|nr:MULTISPECIES: RNA 2',3'-cyclic phosphodiesterase [Marinobacter]MCK7551289.1 RNA 2',3'-cyclic phosphodiesterase [Marinobacter goseongensis]MDV3504944.1 RNA 2',3'-cyclic phosphodiesterase [Marinobacter sp. M-5]